MLELDFGDTPDKLKEEYLDVYEGIHSEILSTSRFDENSDLSTTHLGKVKKKQQNQGGGIISYIRTRIHHGKAVRWNRMSNFVRHRS